MLRWKADREREIRRRFPPVNISSATKMREKLPFPVVYYPGHYGVFLAFAEDDASTPCLCACAASAVRNYIEFRRQPHGTWRFNDALRDAPFPIYDFPAAIATLSLQYPNDPIAALTFHERLCHRCILTMPTLMYCHPMYGTRFIQRYGWYVNQVYLHLGIWPNAATNARFLPAICPNELQEELRVARQLQLEYAAVYNALSGGMRPTSDAGLSTFVAEALQGTHDEVLHNLNRLHTRAARAARIVSKKVENIARQEFGFRKVGEGWVSETILVGIVTRLLPGERIDRHHRPDWLGGLELDIFVPGRKLAVEYQGQQHYHAIAAWGGADALQKLQQRDARKAILCQQSGVALVQIAYTEPLTEDHIAKRLQVR